MTRMEFCPLADVNRQAGYGKALVTLSAVRRMNRLHSPPALTRALAARLSYSHSLPTTTP